MQRSTFEAIFTILSYYAKGNSNNGLIKEESRNTSPDENIINIFESGIHSNKNNAGRLDLIILYW